ncbi:unnamed protein product [Heligmosomoides polygyrus]|uniref:Uncharacterized protein n=1 Tax=Heligmosomoides polygyrus TaxID=6339 RepID=A0A183FXM0_HELPZ|nr:unnamed protein product [Heligmosomoides polygyrus]
MATFASRSNRRLLSASFTGAAADVERPTVFGVVVNVDGRPAVICAVLVSAKRPGACEEESRTEWQNHVRASSEWLSALGLPLSVKKAEYLKND